MEATLNGNGKLANATVMRDRLRAARLEAKTLEAELSVKAIKQTQKLWESADNTGQWVSAWSDRLSRWNSDPSVYNFSSRHDRQHGRNFPLFQNEQELSMIRMQSRILCGTNSAAIGLLEGLTSYVIGKGFIYEAVARDTDHPNTPLVEAVQKIIDEFIERNQWYGGEQPSLEDETFVRSCEDGEFFLNHFVDSEGLVTVRTVEPEQVVQPAGETEREWSFGIRTEADDAQKVYAYWIIYGENSVDGEERAVDRVTHFRRNSKRSIKRGLPDFSFDTLDALHIASKLRKSMGMGAAIQASIAAIRKHASASEAQVSSLATRLANWTQTNPTTRETENVQHHGPGRILDIPEGLDYVPPPAYTGAQTFVEILQACLRGAGQRWNAPEGFSSGDYSNSNFASSLVAEAPFVRTIQRRQMGYRQANLRSMWLAVECAATFRGGLTVWEEKKDGRYTEETYTSEQIKKLVDIQAEPPSVETRDRLQESQMNQMYVSLGVKSPQTVQQELGLDSDQEQVNTEEWAERHGGMGSPLPLPSEDGAPPVPSVPGMPKRPGQQSAGDVGLDDKVDPEGDQSPAVATNDLRTTVGGSAGVAALQKGYYSGEYPRNAAIANATIVFGFTEDEAAQLFPEEAPTKMTPEPGAGGAPPEAAGSPEDMLGALESMEEEDDPFGIIAETRLFEADLLEREEGEVWKGASGRWFTIRKGRAVPTKNPGGDAEKAGSKKKEKDDSAPDKGLGQEAEAAWSEGDHAALERVSDKVKQMSAATRGGLGVAGLKKLAGRLGVKDAGKLKKAGLVAGVMERLGSMKATAGIQEVAARLDRIKMAEAGTGITFKDRLINGALVVSGVTKSDRYQQALADVGKNGSKAKASNRSYMKTVRENALRDLAGGKIDSGRVSHILSGLSEAGYGTVKREELDSFLDGSLGKTASAKPSSDAIIPDDVGLEKARPKKRAKATSAPAKQEDYIDRLRQPLSARLEHIRDMEEAGGGTSFFSSALHGIVNHPDMPNIGGREEYEQAIGRVVNSEHPAASDIAEIDRFAGRVMNAVRNGEIDQRIIGAALEDLDTNRQGALKAHEFVKLASRIDVRNRARLIDPHVLSSRSKAS